MAIKFNTGNLTNPEYNSFKIEKFNGVDYTTTPTEVDDTRAIDLSNYVPRGNSLVKRNGYKKVADLSGSLKIHDIWQFKGKYLVRMYQKDVSIGKYNVIYQYTTSLDLVSDFLNDNNKTIDNIIVDELLDAYAVEFNGMLFILADGKYQRFDGEKLYDIRKEAYIPTVAVGIGHSESNDNMMLLEDRNLLSDSVLITLNQYVPEENNEVLYYNLGSIIPNGLSVNSITIENETSKYGDWDLILNDKNQIAVTLNKDTYFEWKLKEEYDTLKFNEVEVNNTTFADYAKLYKTEMKSVEFGAYVKTSDFVDGLTEGLMCEDNTGSKFVNIGSNGAYALPDVLNLEDFVEDYTYNYFVKINRNNNGSTPQKVYKSVYGSYVKLSELLELTSYKPVGDYDCENIFLPDTTAGAIARKYGKTITSDMLYDMANITVNDIGKEDTYVAFYGTTNESITLKDTKKAYIKVDCAKLKVMEQVEKEEFTKTTLPNLILKIKFDKDFYDTIAKCQFGIPYGSYGHKDRLFVSGNPNYPNVDYHTNECTYPLEFEGYLDIERSDWKDYTYFGDMSFTEFGTSDKAITGYGMLSTGAMCVFKESAVNSPNLYLRNYAITQDSAGNYIEQFPTTISGATVGSEFKNQIIQYDNHVIVNTPNGLYLVEIADSTAVQSYTTKEMTYMIRDNIGTRVDNSSFVVFENKLYLSREDKNGKKRVYVADSNRYTFVNDKLQYEWWVLDDIIADKLFIANNKLCFLNKEGIYEINEGQTYDERLYETTNVKYNDQEYTGDLNVESEANGCDLVVSNKMKQFKDVLNAEDIELEYQHLLQHAEIKIDGLYLHYDKHCRFAYNTFMDIGFDIKEETEAIRFSSLINFLSLYNVKLETGLKDSFNIRNWIMKPNKAEMVVGTDYIAVRIRGVGDYEDVNDTELIDGVNVYISKETPLKISDMEYIKDENHYKLSECKLIEDKWYYVGTKEHPDYLELGTKENVIFNHWNLSINGQTDFNFSADGVLKSAKITYKRPILAYWYSKYTDLGAPIYLKTGYSLTFVPDGKIGGFTSVGYKTAKMSAITNTDAVNRYLNYNLVDFDDFSFTTNYFAQTYTSKKKIKNFSFMQFVLYSNVIETSSIVKLSMRYRITKNNKGVK